MTVKENTCLFLLHCRVHHHDEIAWDTITVRGYMIEEYLSKDLPFHLGFLAFFPSFPVQMKTASKVWKLEILFPDK